MKIAKRIIIGIALTLIILSVALGTILVNKVENFERLTFEKVLETKNDYYSNHYGIGDAKNPGDFGFPDYKTVEFSSLEDGIKLSAWHVESKDKETKKCIVLLHGHHANRLRTMKYLRLLGLVGLDGQYAFFIPDLRNSGMSEEARSSMGYEFAEDIYSTLIYLNRTYKYNTFIIYGFSMGAMGTAIMLDRDGFHDDLKDKGITISKIIFDSPVSNVSKLIYNEGVNKKKMNAALINYGLFAYNIRLLNYLSRMRLSQLYSNVDIPLLILQSKNDPTTLYDHLQGELENLDNKNVTVHFFDTGKHVKIYQTKENTARYTKLVADFIRK